ncbi:MAG: hypothetical protein IPK19_31560 [Chloroflexi bacterium]|nr:hypothetical protein [Chloroflexota bacterium]
MARTTRPTHIDLILNAFVSDQHQPMKAELENYIAELEARQPERPERIASLLHTVGAEYPPDVGTSLNAYITDLEARQQSSLTVSRRAAVTEFSEPPVWSHQRTSELAQRRLEQAAKKQQRHLPQSK